MKDTTVKTVMKSLVLSCGLALAGNALAADTPYVIEDGKLDLKTWYGMKIYQRGRCEACHGPDAKGGAAFPNLLEALKTMERDDLAGIVKNGRNTMPPMLQGVMGIKLIKKKGLSEDDAMDSLYAYLKGRSDGAIPAGSLKKIKK